MSDTNRRNFLTTTSAAAALGTGVLGNLSAKAYAGGDDAVRIGLVGCGGRGRGAAAQALQTRYDVKLVAMGDVFRDRLDDGLNIITRTVKDNETAHVEVDEDHKFIGFDAFQKVIDSDVDLVILATPPGFRPIQFEYAVEQGKHVFFEKPVATDAPGVRKVLEAAKAAKEKNLKVGVGLQRRHQPCYLEFVDRIHSGEIGDIRAMRVYWNGGGVWEPRKSREECRTEMEYQMRNWYYYNWLCGDHICEQHIHNLDVGNWLMAGQIPEDPEDILAQYPVSAIGMGGRQVRTDARYGEIFDHHACQYTYSDGTVMISECRHIRNCWNSVTEHAHGTNGIAHLDNNPRNVSIEYASSDVKRQYKGANDNPYQVEHDDLFAAIRDNQAYSEADYGALSTMTAILGRMATYSGKEVSMKEALEKGANIMPADFSWDADPPTVPGPDGTYPVPVPGVTNVFA